VQRHVERFLDCITDEDYAPNTVLAYQGDLVQLLEYLQQEGKTTWEQVTKEDITDYFSYLRARGYASSTITRKMAAISSFFNFLISRGIITDAPTGHISLPQAKRPSNDYVLSEEEVERLLTYTAQDQTPRGLRDHVLLGLMVKAGFRPSELVALNLEDVEALSSQLSAQGYDSLRNDLERYVREGRTYLVSSTEESALFLSVGVGAGGSRLTRQGGWLIVKKRAEACGLEGHVSPRALRRTHLAQTRNRDVAESSRPR